MAEKESPQQNRQQQKGVALMMAIFFVALMSFMLFEISKETLYTSIVTSQDLHELKAYYAAKAGLDISLLRIKAYQEVRSQIAQMGDVAAGYAQKADIVWQFPFTWPPVLPDEAGMVAQTQLNDILKETFMQKVEFVPVIEDMGARINLNNLDSPSKALADATREQILEIFRKKIRDDQNFSNQYVINEIETVLNNITDWMDADTESKNGGDESSIYSSRGEKNLPPNQYFKTMEELLLVEGMTTDLYAILEPNITIWGHPGVNINQASSDIIMSLDPAFTEDMVKELIRRREDQDHGPFNEDLFKTFVEQYFGSYESFNPNKIPIVYSAVANFRIESSGMSGRITRTIEAYTLDQNALLQSMVQSLKEKEEQETGTTDSSGVVQGSLVNNTNNTNTTTSTQTAKTTTPSAPPKGAPPIVFMKIY